MSDSVKSRDEYWWLDGPTNMYACEALQTSTNSSTVLNCRWQFSYMCIIEFLFLQLDQMATTTEVTNSHLFAGHIGLVSHADDVGFRHKINIRVEEGLKIRMNFKLASLRKSTDPSVGCVDYVGVSDVEKANGQHHQICGHFDNITFYMSNHISVNVYATNVTSLVRFSLVYKALNCTTFHCETGCGNISFVQDDGWLRTEPATALFAPFSSCEATVTVPRDKFVQMEIVEYSITIESDGSCPDRGIISIPNANAMFGCVSSDFPPLIIANSSRLTMLVTTGRELTAVGFRARIKSSDLQGCAVGTDLSISTHCCTTSPGILASRFYPDPSPISVLETWLLIAPRTSFIKMVFHTFVIPEDSQSTLTVYEITDLTSHMDATNPGLIIATFCSTCTLTGNDTSVQSDVNKVKITLNVDPAGGTLYHAEYVFVDVAGNIDIGENTVGV
ncbi:uncharacterized protein [Diadema setosum]|uniref:uncharacterized protein n=1 Tax=Diadema setosum TaxID=31175 RepID=UPI003B3A70D7